MDAPQYEEIVDGSVTWRIDTTFVKSNWRCIWGRGCVGIENEPAEELALGCCSVGAHLDEDDAMRVSAFAAMTPRSLFQHIDTFERDGAFSDDTRTNTRVVDGACVFLNRPGFAGGAGCALHLAAVASDESPIDWKPSVCWQLPIKVDWEPVGEGDDEVATLRAWRRSDWGVDGQTMAWCCTERDGPDGERAFVDDRPVLDSLAEELTEIVGETVFVELRRRLSGE